MTCGKRRYGTRTDAAWALLLHLRQGNEADERRAKPYFCEHCEAWHWGHMDTAHAAALRALKQREARRRAGHVRRPAKWKREARVDAPVGSRYLTPIN